MSDLLPWRNGPPRLARPKVNCEATEGVSETSASLATGLLTGPCYTPGWSCWVLKEAKGMEAKHIITLLSTLDSASKPREPPWSVRKNHILQWDKFPLMQINHLRLAEASVQEGYHLSSGAGLALDRRSAAWFATPRIQIALRETKYWMTQNRSFTHRLLSCHPRLLPNLSGNCLWFPLCFSMEYSQKGLLGANTLCPSRDIKLKDMYSHGKVNIQ